METNITENYLEIGNQKYFRGNAHLVQLGTYGEKKDPLGARAYIDPQAKVKAEHLEGRVQNATIASIDWAKTSKAAVEVNGALRFFGLDGKVEENGTFDKIKAGRLKLANFFIAEGPLKTILNNGADGARNFLADEGRDGRVVSEVWVGLEVELAEYFAAHASKSLSVKAKGAELTLTVSGGQHGAQSVTFAPGTTFAYKLHKVKNWSNGKKHIDDMEADYKGMS
jgi:hypothetical protein